MPETTSDPVTKTEQTGSVAETSQKESKQADPKTVTMTVSELESLVDRKVTQGIQTREATLKVENDAEVARVKSEAEAKLVAESGGMGEIVSALQSQLAEMQVKNAESVLALETKEMLERVGVPELGVALTSDGTTLEGRTAMAEAFKRALDEKVEGEIGDRLKTKKLQKVVSSDGEETSGGSLQDQIKVARAAAENAEPKDKIAAWRKVTRLNNAVMDQAARKRSDAGLSV